MQGVPMWTHGDENVIKLLCLVVGWTSKIRVRIQRKWSLHRRSQEAVWRTRWWCCEGSVQFGGTGRFSQNCRLLCWLGYWFSRHCHKIQCSTDEILSLKIIKMLNQKLNFSSQLFRLKKKESYMPLNGSKDFYSQLWIIFRASSCS